VDKSFDCENGISPMEWLFRLVVSCKVVKMKGRVSVYTVILRRWGWDGIRSLHMSLRNCVGR
jgi:hypothetical protein